MTMYSETHKTVEYEDDCSTQVMIFNSSMNMKFKTNLLSEMGLFTVYTAQFLYFMFIKLLKP